MKLIGGQYMKSNFKKDINVEREVGKFLDIHLYPHISNHFFRVDSKNFQKKGIDLELESKGLEYLIDEKCAFYYANKNLQSFTFELSFKFNGHIKTGWFLNPELNTTHYNLMWLNTIDSRISPLDITAEQIREIEVMTISKERIQEYLNKLNLSDEKLKILAENQRLKKIKRNFLNKGIDLIFSNSIPEEPINLKINKVILKELAEQHYKVNNKEILNEKKKLRIQSYDLPDCSYSYVLQTPFDAISEKEDMIRKLIKKGIKVLLFTDKEVKIFEKDLLDSTLLQIFYNEEYKIDKEVECIDGINEYCMKEIAIQYANFNIEQFLIEHAEAKENLAIKAGAGTGKTTVMVDRIIYLMTKENMDPSNIVLVTFTRNSAKAMYEKLKQALIKKYETTGSSKFLNSAEKLNNMRIQTISSFSKGLLKELGQLNGLGLSFKLRGFKAEKKKWLEIILNELLEENEAEEESIRRMLSPLSYHEFIDTVYDFWEEFENNGINAEEISSTDFGQSMYSNLTNQLIEKMIKRAVLKYRIELQKINAISLNDLTREIDEIRRNFGSGVFKNLHNQIEFLFIDEFQDSDKSQIGLFASIQEAFNAKIFVVGDTNQSIYRFRGAQHTAFEILEKYLADRSIKLNGNYRLIKNYRSSKNLLIDMQVYFKKWKENNWLHKNYKDLEGMKNLAPSKSEVPLRILTVNKKKEHIKHDVMILIKDRWNHYKALNEVLSESEEKRNMAIITRTRAEARLVYKWCRAESIPVSLKVGGDFYTSEVIKDFNELLLFLLYPNEIKFLLPTLMGPYGGKSFDFEKINLEKGFDFELESVLKNIDRKLFDYIDQLRYRPIFSVLRSIVEERQVINKVYSRIYRRLKKENPSEKDDMFIRNLAISETHQYKLNLGKLFEIMHQKFSEEFVTLLQIQSWLEISMATERKENQEIVESDNKIEIITAHGAKGLEYYSVIIPFTHRIFENNFSKILFEQKDPSNPIKVGWKISKNKSIKLNNYFDDMEKVENTEVLEEEARLLYVAMTRAEGELCIIKNEIYDKYNYTWSKLLSKRGE